MSEQSSFQRKHLQELAARAAKQGDILYSRFLTPAECADAHWAARQESVNCAFFGGYEDAERRIAAFSVAALTEMPEDAPIRWLSIHWDVRFGDLAHRDLLGATLSLGLDRDVFGDIIIQDNNAYLVVREEIVPYVCEHLVKAGNTSVLTTQLTGQPDIPKPVYRVRHDTVSSLRLDAVIATAFHLSRSEAAGAIRSGLCKVDHRQIMEPDFMLEQGMMLSLRGKGRVRLGEIGDLNRKGRVGISLLYNE